RGTRGRKNLARLIGSDDAPRSKRPYREKATERAFWEGTRTMHAKLPDREVSEVARGSNGGVPGVPRISSITTLRVCVYARETLISALPTSATEGEIT